MQVVSAHIAPVVGVQPRRGLEVQLVYASIAVKQSVQGSLVVDVDFPMPSALPYLVGGLPSFFINDGFLRVPRDNPLAFGNLYAFLVFKDTFSRR